MRWQIIAIMFVVLLVACKPTVVPTPKFVITESKFRSILTTHDPLSEKFANIDQQCDVIKLHNSGKDTPFDPWQSDYVKNGFVITTSITGIESASKSQVFDCYVINLGIKYYGKFKLANSSELKAKSFCNDLSSTNCISPFIDITKSNEINLCCSGVCRKQILAAYCK